MKQKECCRIDSKLIINLAVKITGLRGGTICREIGLIEKNTKDRFINGYKESGKCYWPEQSSWFIGRITESKIPLDDLLVEKQKFPLGADDRKSLGVLQRFIEADKNTYKPEYYPLERLRKQKTVDTVIYEYILQLLKDNLYTFDAAKQYILEVCKSNNIHPKEIEYLSSMTEPSDSIETLVTFLVRKGKQAKQQPRFVPLVENTGKLPNERTTVGDQIVEKQHVVSTSVKICQSITNTKNEIRIVPYTYQDLHKQGLTSQDVSKRLMANDAVLYGAENLGANAGKIEQWAAQIEAAQDNWLFFCEEGTTNIIGNWSITFLTPEEELSVRKGTFAGDDFSLSSVNYPLMASDKEIVIYILNISLNEGYTSHENWAALWKSFGNRIWKMIQSGITIRRVYSDLFRDDHVEMFEKMGFRHLVKNKVSGEIYCLDLSKPDLMNFGWIMPDSQITEQSITFRQLSHNDILEEQQLVDLAGLIYDTDKYVYPPLFSRKQAKEILPLLFASNEDSMFTLDNIFCAMIEKRIVGLILHRRGPLTWDADKLLEYASTLNITLPDTVRTVEQDYFKGYEATAADTTAILNCCVNSNYRMRNEIRLGTRMMQAFIEQHPERLELYVLQETKAAMRMYLRTGFKLAGKCNGFSVDRRELPCFFL